jgi:hypothetical protein
MQTAGNWEGEMQAGTLETTFLEWEQDNLDF